VWSARESTRIRKTFATLAEARAWRSETQTGVRRGVLRAPGHTTVREAAEELVDGMKSGRVRTRSGDRYKPSAIRSYRGALRDHVVTRLGAHRLGDVQHRDVQRIADDLLAQGRDPSTIRNALMPLRVIFRRAVEDGDLAINPCSHLRLPAVRGRRERIASPEEAEQLLAVLSESDRAVWATALYAGLRRGELMALRWEDVDLAAGVIHVERAYDEKERVDVEPKSRAGRRSVPIVGALRDELVEHKTRERRDAGLVFGSSAETPFQPSNTWRRAQTVRNARVGRSAALASGVVARIRDERAAGNSLRAIARGLTADQIPTAHGGAQWWPSTIRAVLDRSVPAHGEAAIRAGLRPIGGAGLSRRE
jgi:integrase